MKDQSKTKHALIQELVSLKQRIAGLEQSESERKQAEEVLRESEEKYRLIFEYSPLGLLSFDKKGVIVACNDNFVQIIGSSREKLIGLNMLNLPDKNIVSAVQQALNGSPGLYESDYSSTTAKKNTPVRCLFTPMNVGGGAITGGVGIIEDITERKRLEFELLRANENNFLNIFDNAADGILIADIESRKFYSGNPAICRMLGYSLEEIKNLGIMDIHPEKDISYVIDHFEKLAKGEMTVSRDLPVKRKDGAVIYANVNATTITLAGKTYLLGFFHDITERKEAEAKREAAFELLRKSEKYFKEITENSSDIVIITDKNGDIKYCSRSIERFTGYKPEELIGRSGFLFIHPDDVERAVVDYGKTILTTDSAIPNSFRIVCKDGSERCLEGLGKNLLDNPDVAGFIMNVRDITERRKMEAQRESALELLRQSEDKYRTILENMQESYYELDLAGNFTFVNNTVCRNLGYSKDELIGMNYRQYTDKEDLQRVFQAYSKVYLTGEPFEEFCWQVIKKDGTKMYIEGSASLKKDSVGKPIGFKGIDHDITDRKKAEEEMRQSEEKYRTILENIEDGYYEVDLAGNFTFFNDSLCRILGYSKEELMGMNNRQYTDKEHSKKLFQAFNKVYKTGEPTKEFNWQVIRKDGTKKYIEASTSLQKDSSGKPIGFRGIVRDITERRQAEFQKEEMLDSLRESDERYKALFDHSLDIVFVNDFEGRIIDANAAALNRLGYTREEIPSVNFASFLSEDQLPRALKIQQEIQETGVQKEVSEFKLRHKNGSEVYVETIGSTIISNGTPFAVHTVARDITERKRTESQKDAVIELLKESEMKYRHLYEKSRDAIVILEPPSWKFTAGNPAAIEMFKAKNEEEFVSCDPWKLSPERQPDGRASDEKAKEMIEKAVREGFNFFEWTHKRINGEEFLATVLLSRVEKGDNVFLQATVRDITRRRQEKNAIKESEERFRSIVSRSEDAIIVTDAKGKIKFMNPAAGRVFNREVESFLGTDFGLPLVDGESTEIDIFRPGKDPGVGDMYVVKTEWLGEKAHLITIRDITERKQIEVKIKKAQEALFIINNKLEERNWQNSLLSEMRELLQSCSNGQEVPAIVVSYATQLFHGTDGALFLLSDSRTALQSVASWGNFPEDVDNHIFAPDACWGLRQGRVYVVENMKTSPICPHLKQSLSNAYVCLPLIGKGELFGLLHLGTKRSAQEDDRQWDIAELKEIAVIFAEYLSLSIANIKLSEKLTSQSIRDPLTRLYNRRYMDEIIQHEILRAARQQTMIGIVMVDIDHFKQINDTYGHETGDEYLMELADFFRLKIRGSDFVFRYGGEEFMLILPESSVEDTYKYAELLRKEIKNMKIHFRGQRLPSITLSFGIAAYPDHGLDTIELIRVADKALYTAKEAGRDRVIIG
jgi:diguanylate cyclase (GGDEF)-like protein/PAS domain S-box-containing protein